ncbi:tetratricopeptide repeat protein [Flavobacterium sp. CYK-55]|uniref:tetratricopeptide repeat-containing sensor histidine kinase n=1 Tax=Flavobacterium sp. CYK-55 TaxID=2835529 RepID=UPI001BCE3444|nr:tetratricopeptide repeat protein [Flavobacterium sp. CYK-55]MBS7787439.1 tetratricopeptide repeat protein [Flavobacterium sp. CYK-55]
MKRLLYIVCLIFLCTSGPCIFGQKPSAKNLIKQLKHTSADTVKVNLYNKIADQYKTSQPDSLFYFAQKAQILATKIQYPLGLAHAYINLGNHALILGKYEQALEFFKRVDRKLNTSLENESNPFVKNTKARALASIAVVYTQQSNYYKALEFYQKALKIYQETADKISISKCLNNIGIVYKSQSNLTKALEYLKQAVAIQEQIKEPNTAMTLTNIGVIYFERHQYEPAKQYYEQAEKLFSQNNNPLGSALLANYWGDYFQKKQQSEQALSAYEKALNLYESMQNKFGASLALYNIAKLYAAQKQYNLAMPYVQKSLAYAQNIGVLDQAYHSEKLLSEIYAALHQTEASFAHYRNYIAARDSINNLENSKKFAQAEMNFEYQKKEALLAEQNKRQRLITLFIILGCAFLAVVIILLYNKRQVKRRLTLQKEVAEYEQKALHLQMNPHFVFNCLGAISSFIVQNGTDSALKYLSKFSKLMRLTLEYSKGSLIPIDKEIESLQNYLELEQLRFRHKFEFSISSSPKVEFNMGIPPLLIQPFVENAILHGMVPKDGNGQIEIAFDVVDQQFICTVTDDGVGLSESKMLKENSVTAHKSMALEITKKRLEIMESITSKSAQIEIEELNNEHQKAGTRVTLRLPIQYIP